MATIGVTPSRRSASSGRTATSVPNAPEYWVIDAMVGYTINDQITLQLNGYNLADEEYICSLNNSGTRYIPGTPRSALLSVNYTF